MKYALRPSSFFLFLTLSLSPALTFSQNVGVGTAAPQARLHVKGTYNLSELIIDADTNQTNLNPMIRLRKSDGTDLVWMHSNRVDNFFLGVNSGISMTAGIYNTAIGMNVLKSSTTGDYNTGLGTNVLPDNTTGRNNTAIGALSLFKNSVGNNNTASGSSALYNNTTGVENTANGGSA